jgi:diguanylate cyclase (GGDEF)-like protein/PAS domain S-box-containing protein
MPFAAQGRLTVTAILVTFAMCSAVSVAITLETTSHSQHRAQVLQVAARQRTLAERYVNEVLLGRTRNTDPSASATILTQSAAALLDGGVAPAVNGDDDQTRLPPATGRLIRGELRQEERIVGDLTATGAAILAGQPVSGIPLRAREHVGRFGPIMRLRVLSALTSNVSLNAARTIAAQSDEGISHLIRLQAVLGAVGCLVSILLALALRAATRRQTAHFRSIVASSSDLVLVYRKGVCRYTSDAVGDLIAGRAVPEAAFLDRMHPDDRPEFDSVRTSGHPRNFRLRVRDRFGEWRHLDGRVTDLRSDRWVRGLVISARDITERVCLEEELTRQAYHDALTGLPNRALFGDRLEQALARHHRTGDPLAVMLLDLDAFKQVNDSLGHEAGDDLLKQLAPRLVASVRPSDTVARLGGDEFALLVEGADGPAAEAAAQRVLDAVTQSTLIGERELSVGASIGIVIHRSGGVQIGTLLRHADVAMYAAKDAGRGGYRLFHEQMADDAGEALTLEHELRVAVGHGDVVLHYQPEVRLDTGEIIGVEALARWTSPSQGPIPPDKFIAIAEATGLIIPLGEHLLDSACRQTAVWCQAGLIADGFTTWVNLSGRQLSHGGVARTIADTLKRHKLSADVLGLEVTETALVQGGAAGERARSELRELHELGVRLAVDDFGTGFSSLGQLRQFPIDVIKVDRSFVHGLQQNEKDTAITASVVGLAQALDLVAIAEGIESPTQLESLRALGCDVGQGYLFARPAPASDVTAALKRSAASADAA